MTIPKTRPVLWQDLDDLRERLGYTRVQMCKYLGIPQRKWELNMRKDPHAPIDDKTVAMLARIYDDDKNLLPEEDLHDMRKFFEKEVVEFAGVEQIKKRHYGPLLGRSSGAGYAWIDNPGQRISKPVESLIRAVKKATLNKENEESLNPFLMLKKYSQIEAKVSEVDPFETGRWFAKKKKK